MTKTKIEHYSHSSFTLLDICPMAWYSKYIEGLKEPQTDAMNFGLKTESMIAEKMGFKSEEDKEIEKTEKMDMAVKAYFESDRAWNKADSYQEKITLDPDRFKFLLKEMDINLPAPNLEYIGYIDFTKDGVIMDLKTSRTKTVSTYWAEQILMYLIAKDYKKGEIHLITKTKTPSVFFIDYYLSNKLKEFVLRNVCNKAQMADGIIKGNIEPVIKPSWKCSSCPKNDCPGKTITEIGVL